MLSMLIFSQFLLVNHNALLYGLSSVTVVPRWFLVCAVITTSFFKVEKDLPGEIQASPELRTKMKASL